MSWLTPEQMAKHEITPEEVAEFEAFEADDSPTPPQREEPKVAHKYPIDDALYGRQPADERTGLPAYPKSTAGTQMKLRNVAKQLGASRDRLNVALATALTQFEQAFANEDRATDTQARIDALAKKRNQRRI
jgi:hypothetical protein